MKPAFSVMLLLVLLLALPFADATPRNDRAKHVRDRVRQRACENIADTAQKKLCRDFAQRILSDQRLTLDPSLFARPAAKPLVPKPKKPDYDYVFSDWSLERGKRFLKENEGAFALAKQKFGIPPEEVNAFLNIETQWGRELGKRPVIVTLYTLAVMRPNFLKAGWAEGQLAAFVRLCARSCADPFLVKGSRTGAFGLAQFEPTSYFSAAARCYDDGKAPDLFARADAICSIARYLHRAGWNANDAARRKAILAYNHDGTYASAVMDYADLISNNIPPRRYVFTHPPSTELAAIKK